MCVKCFHFYYLSFFSLNTRHRLVNGAGYFFFNNMKTMENRLEILLNLCYTV